MTIKLDLPPEILDRLGNPEQYFQNGFVTGLTVSIVGIVALMVVQLWSKNDK